MVYNVKDIGIYEVYKLVWKEAFYDEYKDKYFLDSYYEIVDYRLGIVRDNTIIDIVTGKKYNFFNNELQVDDIFISNQEYRKFNYYFKKKDVEMKKETILDMYQDIYASLFDENKLKVSKLLQTVTDYNIKDKTLQYYFNDNYDDYYDELKEYRKMSMLWPKDEEEKKLRILM